MLQKKGLMIGLLCLAQVFIFTGTGFSQKEALLINGRPYIRLNDVASLYAFGIQWDPFLKNYTLMSGHKSLMLHIGSEYAWTDGRLLQLSEPVLLHEGVVVAPASLSPHLEELERSAVFRAPTAKSVRVIVLDPGHGGRDYGAISAKGTREKDIALDVALRVKKQLEGSDLRIIMTRDTDVFIPLAARAKVANKKEADLFVSIHVNASTTNTLNGFEVYYLSDTADHHALAVQRAENTEPYSRSLYWTNPSHELKTMHWDLQSSANRRLSVKLAEWLREDVGENVDTGPLRVKDALFYVLKWTECPAVLVETGYISNEGDEGRLVDPQYREEMAVAIARAILRYKKEFDATNGFTFWSENE